MNATEVARVQQGFAAVLPRSDAVAQTFYNTLFTRDPALRSLFKGDMTDQRRKLMLTLGTVVQQLHALDSILPAIRGLAARHVTYGVKAVHYDLVGRALLDALAAHLPAFTDDDRAAWSAAYRLIAGEMMRAASQLRAAA